MDIFKQLCHKCFAYLRFGLDKKFQRITLPCLLCEERAEVKRQQAIGQIREDAKKLCPTPHIIRNSVSPSGHYVSREERESGVDIMKNQYEGNEDTYK